MNAMNTVKVLTLCFGIWYCGDLIHHIFPVIPGIIAAFFLLFFLLTTRVIKIDSVQLAEQVLVPIIGVFFVPSVVNLYFIWAKISSQFLPFLLFIIFAFFIVFIATFFTSTVLIVLLRSFNKKEKK